MNRYEYLDGIRTLAALFVVVRHTGEFFNFTFYRSYLAVDLFFILSGFVIASAYEKKLLNNTLSFNQFLSIRAIRLYPVYFASLLLAFAAWVNLGLPLYSLCFFYPRCLPLVYLYFHSTLLTGHFFLKYLSTRFMQKPVNT
jgi:peptidoglycan/LPS O-acetylase OafA/YrhL